MVAEYFASVDDGLMRALRDRPTALERWTSGVRPGHQAGHRAGRTRTPTRSTRSGCPRARPTTSRRVEVTFPSGRTADEICPTEIAVPVWCAHMGTLTFHPWPVRRADVDHPDELRIDLDPQPGTTFTDAVRVAGVARELLEELGLVGYPKTSRQPRHPHLRPDRAALGVHRPAARRDRLRPRARAAATTGVTIEWWKEERGERIFVDFNQNNRDRTIASAYSLRPLPGRAGLHADDLGRAGRRHRPAGVQPVHRPRPAGRRRPVGGDRRHGVLARAAAAALGGAARAAR